MKEFTLIVNLLSNEDAMEYMAEEILELYEIGYRVMFIQRVSMNHCAISFVEREEEITQ